MTSPASPAAGSSTRTSTTATSPAPPASAIALGAAISELAAAAVRPSTASGVSRCTAVIAAISTHGRPAPMAVLAASATRSPPSARAPTATANTAVPAAANVRSGIRRNRGPASRPTATEPAPWKAYNTPAYAGGRPRASSTTAYTAAPLSPASSIVSAPAYTSGRRTGEPRSSRIPAAVPPGRAASRPLAGSRTRRRAKSRAARANVTASSATTAPAPYRVNRPAPARGASSFMPSFAVVRSPLKSPSSRASSACATRAASAASRRTPLAPYTTRTAKSTPIRWPGPTRSREAIRPAITRFTVTSRSLRGTRSATAPRAGPARTGAHMAPTVRAARLSDPVADLTQIPAVSHIADVPKPDTSSPVRQSRAVRSPATTPNALTCPPVHPPRPGRALRWPC